MGFFGNSYGGSGPGSSNYKPVGAQPDYDPQDKPLDWFGTSVGIQSLKKYTTPKACLLSDTIIERYKEENDGDFERFFRIYFKNGGCKASIMYFHYFVTAIYMKGDTNYGPLTHGNRSYLLQLLCALAETYELDDDGEPFEVESEMAPEDIVSFVRNPLLHYVSSFKFYLFRDDEDGSLIDKTNLFNKVLYYLSIYCAEDKEILNKDAFLLEKGTYFNSVGTVRKKKSFIKYCIEKSVNPSFWQKELEKLEQ